MPMAREIKPVYFKYTAHKDSIKWKNTVDKTLVPLDPLIANLIALIILDQSLILT